MAKTETNGFLKFLGYCYIPIFLLALFFNGWFVYYKMVLEDNTWSLTSNFVDDSTYNPGTYFIDINYYTNERGNGKEVFEVQFNYYIETSIPEKKEDGTYESKYIMSSGVQFYDTPISSAKAHSDIIYGSEYKQVLQNCEYYTAPEGLNYGYFVTDTNITNKNEWIWDIDGNLCLMEEVGVVEESKFLWLSNTREWNVEALIVSLYNSLQTIENGETITMFDFTPYLNVTKMFNSETGKMENDFTMNDIQTYANIRINKSENGMVEATQSLFNSYRGDTEWTSAGSGLNELYWDDFSTYEITSEDFTFEKVDEGRLIYLKPSCETFLQEFSNVQLIVNIDLDYFENLTIIGLKQGAFEDFKIFTFEITSSTAQDFYIYDDLGVEIWNGTNVNILGGVA